MTHVVRKVWEHRNVANVDVNVIVPEDIWGKLEFEGLGEVGRINTISCRIGWMISLSFLGFSLVLILT